MPTSDRLACAPSCPLVGLGAFLLTDPGTGLRASPNSDLDFVFSSDSRHRRPAGLHLFYTLAHCPVLDNKPNSCRSAATYSHVIFMYHRPLSQGSSQGNSCSTTACSSTSFEAAGFARRRARRQPSGQLLHYHGLLSDRSQKAAFAAPRLARRQLSKAALALPRLACRQLSKAAALALPRFAHRQLSRQLLRYHGLLSDSSQKAAPALRRCSRRQLSKGSSCRTTACT